MAPVCLAACRQLLPVRTLLCLSVILLLSLWHSADDLRTYDRSILTHLQSSLELQSTGCLGPHSRFHPTFINSPADCVLRLPCCASHSRKRRRRRRRKRGNRGGVRVRIRGFASVSLAQPSPRRPSIDFAGSRGLYLARRSWDPRYSCHLSISPARSTMPDCPAAPPRLRVRSGGVILLNICPLQRSQLAQPSDYLAAKVSLLNCRSVSNKTFILNDFHTARSGHAVFNRHGLAPAPVRPVFGDLRPTNCSFISTLRSSGRGGGVALILMGYDEPSTLTKPLTCYLYSNWALYSN